MTDITTSTQTVYTTSSVNISWDITAVRVLPQVGTAINVVSEIDWKLIGTSLALEGSDLIEYSLNGTENIEYNPNKPYVDYTNLTKAQIVNWVNISIGHDRIMELISEIKIKVQAEQNPVQNIGLPWTA
jgi:hypothetical protein